MSEVVREMFATIAPRYDLANELLSLGIHRRWRRSLVKRAGLPPGAAVLDCATGTGDLALEFARSVGPSGSVTGIDFCEPMLEGARDKAQAAGPRSTLARPTRRSRRSNGRTLRSHLDRLRHPKRRQSGAVPA